LEIFRISDELAYAEQPGFQALKGLRDAGFQTLVNVRLENEQPAPEGPDVDRTGLDYVHLPIAQPEWSEDHFDALRAILRSRGKLPVLVHSAEGARAGILALTCHAAEAGWTVEQLRASARKLGLTIPDAGEAWLRSRGVAYDGHSARAP
jgi:protein tyrosine phosphatase (PTP) superfamily phosphohydrolase (DUF442 family)